MVTHFLDCCLSEKKFYFCMDIFTAYVVLICCIFLVFLFVCLLLFTSLKISVHFVLAYIVSDKKSDLQLIHVPVYISVIFFWWHLISFYRWCLGISFWWFLMGCVFACGYMHVCLYRLEFIELLGYLGFSFYQIWNILAIF